MPRLKAVEIAGFGIRQQYLVCRKLTRNRPKDLIFHDPIIPAHRIDDCRIEVSDIRSDWPPITTFAGSISPARRETSRALMMRE